MGKVLASVIIDACAGCCGTLGLSWHCESLTGTASLCGISAYSADATPYDAGDPDAWEGQFRKWLNRDLAGLLQWRSGECSSCPDGLTGDGGGDYTFSGTFSVTCDATLYGTVDGINYTNAGCVDTTPFTLAIGSLFTAAFNVVPLACPADGVGGYSTPIKDEHTLLTRTVTACGCYTSDFLIYFETLGEATETLREEVYFFEALLAAGGDVTEGTSCCTELSEADRTTPESISPMTMIGTAVKVPISILNGVEGSTYSVTVTLSQANPQPEDPMEPPVPPTIWDDTIEVEAGTTTNYYPRLPIPGDFPICVISVVLGDPV